MRAKSNCEITKIKEDYIQKVALWYFILIENEMSNESLQRTRDKRGLILRHGISPRR